MGFAAGAAAAVTAAATAGGTACAVGAADALFAAFLGLDDVENGKAQDQGDHGDDDDISRIHNITFCR